MSSPHSIKAELSSRYGLALFELASERKQIENVQADLNQFKSMLQKDSDLRFMLDCPTISRQEKISAILSIADMAKFSKTTRDFLGTVAENNRLFALSGMIDSFFDFIADSTGILKVEVTTASEMTDSQKNKIQQLLSPIFGDKKIHLSLKQDKGLLGGLTIKVGSLLIDDSLKTKIQQLKTVMKGA